ncbi:LMBR1 domain-containing protein 2 [Zancudomyces culisetae]|uniref:LMBR1 domain-containing protein 2 n=1 Tax=Zancudomyces culisetae TaxID=1213189 RepID=A0A1R1PZM7_ZANCU|nr:LMBR1 domain-containing protein 2 [Zancudomyces culisetae]|eukprot:OMH86406.1 LMBR1 domain-containing protein 2 [Zancudomyces culisetae]
MAVANLWGMFMIVGFMGVGLVNIPRKIWMRSNIELEILEVEARASELKDRYHDTEAKISEYIQEFERFSLRAHPTDPEYPYCVIIKQENHETINKYGRCASMGRNEWVESSGQNYHSHPQSRDDKAISKNLTKLAKIRSKLVYRKLKLKYLTRAIKENTNAALLLQDIRESKQNNLRYVQSSVPFIARWPMWRRKATFFWYLYIRTYLYKIASVFLGLLGVLILQSEFIFTISPDFTFISLLFNNVFTTDYFVIELLSVGLVLYMCISIYLSVTNLKLFGIKSLRHAHSTTTGALVICGSQLCRLLIPLCYNFLAISNINEGTGFLAIMGKINAVPILGIAINQYIPFIVLLPAILTYTRAYGRIASLFKPDVDRRPDLSLLSQPSESVYEGRILISRQRAALERGQEPIV